MLVRSNADAVDVEAQQQIRAAQIWRTARQQRVYSETGSWIGNVDDVKALPEGRRV